MCLFVIIIIVNDVNIHISAESVNEYFFFVERATLKEENLIVFH